MIASIVIDLIRDAIRPEFELHNGRTVEVFNEKLAIELGWSNLDDYFARRWVDVRPIQRLECRLLCFYYNKGIITWNRWGVVQSQAALDVADPEFQQKLKAIADRSWLHELQLRPFVLAEPLGEQTCELTTTELPLLEDTDFRSSGII